jgi:nucleoside-diphosphate-sugar epimerase
VVAANLRGTLNLLDKAVRDQTRRFLFVSTHEVYGQGKTVWREEDHGDLDFLSPRSCYPESKRAGENACVCYGRQYGLHTNIARLARVMGPTMNLDSGLFVCDFFKDALTGRDIIIKGDGGLIRPLAYLSDVTAGLVKILFSGEAGQAYNVAPTESPTIRDVARELSRLAGVDCAEPGAPGPGGGAVQDASRLRGLGWSPRATFRDGLAEIWLALKTS